MHETMVAESLVNSIIAEAAKNEGKPIKAKMSCGLLNTVNDEVLTFAFEAISKGTICEGITLEIEHKAMKGKCKDCGKEFDFEIVEPRCSHCGCDSFELLPDPPLLLEEIEFQTE